MYNLPEWLTCFYTDTPIEHDGTRTKGLVKLCSEVFDLLDAKDFVYIDWILLNADYNKLPTIICMAMCRYTYIAKDVLVFWIPTVHEVYNIIKERNPDNVDRIMQGLV